MKLFQREQRSLFGEILDWMLTPLLLLWPISLVLTWFVAQSVAGKPFEQTGWAVLGRYRRHEARTGGLPERGLWKFIPPPVPPAFQRAHRNLEQSGKYRRR